MTKPMVVRVTRDAEKADDHAALLVEDYLPDHLDNFEAVLSTLDLTRFPIPQPHVHSIPSMSHLAEGDIVAIHTDGVINTLYRVNSHHNFLLVTERCNSNCLMCSQPPRDREDVYYLHALH